MAKTNINDNRSYNAKVIIFWALIFSITVLFAVLFIIRFSETRLFQSYNDIEKADLNLVLDINSKEGEYYVYIYSAKKDETGKLIDTASTDIQKANEIFPVVLNYFNYVRRNQREMEDLPGFNKIYGYNVKNNSNDSNLKNLELELSNLPALVKINGATDEVLLSYSKANDIEKELTSVMNKK